MPLALVLAMIMTSVAWADNVYNTLDNTIDNALESETITSGGSIVIGFRIEATSGGGDAPGCNAGGNVDVRMTVNVPSGVTVAYPGGGSSVVIPGCGNNGTTATFSSTTPGTYQISSFTMQGGKEGSLWNTAPAAFTLVVSPVAPTDTTPPTITPQVSGSLGIGGWYVGNVNVSWTVADPESAFTTTGCAATTISADTASTTLPCSATSAGGTTNAPVTIKKDSTPPTYTCGSADGAWHATDVSIGCTAADVTSGLASASSFSLATSVASGSENANASTGTATVSDLAGNQVTAGPITGNKIDRKGPGVTCTPPAGSIAGWLTENVSYACIASDGGSALATAPTFELATSVANGSETADAMTAGATATDNVGNSTAVAPYGPFKIDLKAPSLSCDPPTGNLSGWFGANVAYTCSASDGGSGLATPPSFSVSTAVAPGSESSTALTGVATATDNVGHSVSLDPFGPFMVDLKAPSVICNAPTADAATAWRAENVTFSCSASDSGSGLAASADASFALGTSVDDEEETPGATTNSRTVSDAVGNSTTVGPFGPYNVDRKAPSLGCDPPTGDLTGWLGANVAYTCSAADGGSGLATDTSFEVSTSVPEGFESDAAMTSTAIAIDNVANGKTLGPFGPFMIDRKPPAVSCDAPPADIAAWWGSNVSITCTASDTGSGLASSTDATFVLETTVAEGDEIAGVTIAGRTVVDAAGNWTTVGPFGPYSIDLKAPTIECVPPAGDLSIWLANEVVYTCSAADGGSGVASAGPFPMTTSVGNGNETANAMTGTATAIDKAGNSVTMAAYGPFKVDRRAPSISITSPVGPYVLGSPVLAGYTCSDGGSGLATCVGTVANGAALDTGSVGTKSFSVNAADNVGNSGVASADYQVVYAGGQCMGAPGRQVLQPINSDGTSVFKKGSTVPVKFRVCDAAGTSIGTPGVVTSFRRIGYSNGTVGATNEPVDSTTPDTAFRWSASDQQWIFNLSTKNLIASTTHYYEIILNDGTSIKFQFGLK